MIYAIHFEDGDSDSGGMGTHPSLNDVWSNETVVPRRGDQVYVDGSWRYVSCVGWSTVEKRKRNIIVTVTSLQKPFGLKDNRILQREGSLSR